jgi:D-beta-D-heptose 7-phosphate kinase / D-beta-D-heptose 1-phosphate adenosyltransferase
VGESRDGMEEACSSGEGGGVKFLVVGDGMWDMYHIGSATRMSPEAPIPVVVIELDKQLPGGSWNVAANLQMLGAEAFVPYSGEGVPIKNRLIANGVQIARWDVHDWCSPLDVEEIKKVKADRIVIADYAKGSITPEVLLALYELNLPTFVDTKCDPTPYIGWTTTIFPNVKEYSQFKDAYDRFERCVVTMGEHGASLLEFGKEIEHVGAFCKSPLCVSGAGDTFTASYSIRWPRSDALEFASLAAGVVVGKPMTATVSQKEIDELRKSVRKQNKRKT